MEKPSNTKRLRNIFALIFLLSTGIFFVLMFFYSTVALSGAAPPAATQGPFPSPVPKPEPETLDWQSLLGEGGILAAAGSCLTSITTFIGFIVTTVMNFRRESREKAIAALEREKQEIELERQRLELEKMRRQMDSEKNERR
jgi:hypothetical protein